MKVSIQFDEGKYEVPLERRHGVIERLAALIETEVNHSISNLSAISNPSESSASLSIPYDPKAITNAELGEAIINQAHDCQWGRQCTIYFS